MKISRREFLTQYLNSFIIRLNRSLDRKNVIEFKLRSFGGAGSYEKISTGSNKIDELFKRLKEDIQQNRFETDKELEKASLETYKEAALFCLINKNENALQKILTHTKNLDDIFEHFSPYSEVKDLYESASDISIGIFTDDLEKQEFQLYRIEDGNEILLASMHDVQEIKLPEGTYKILSVYRSLSATFNPAGTKEKILKPDQSSFSKSIEKAKDAILSPNKQDSSSQASPDEKEQDVPENDTSNQDTASNQETDDSSQSQETDSKKIASLSTIVYVLLFIGILAGSYYALTGTPTPFRQVINDPTEFDGEAITVQGTSLVGPYMTTYIEQDGEKMFFTGCSPSNNTTIAVTGEIDVYEGCECQKRGYDQEQWENVTSIPLPSQTCSELNSFYFQTTCKSNARNTVAPRLRCTNHTQISNTDRVSAEKGILSRIRSYFS